MNAEQGAGVYFTAMDDVPIHPDPEIALRKRWLRNWIIVALLLLVGASVSYFALMWWLRRPVMLPPAATVLAQTNNLNVALLSYKAKGGAYPSQAQGLQALMTRPTTAPVPKAWSRLLESLPNDPWMHPYEYRIPSTSPGMAYDLVSLGPDGVPSGDDIVVSVP
jgi:type II secretion system protein G